MCTLAVEGAGIRIQARLGVAADGEEEGIDGGEIAEGVEDDEGEQTAARDVYICSRISFFSIFSEVRKAPLAPGGHLTMIGNEPEMEGGASSFEHRLWQSQYSHLCDVPCKWPGTCRVQDC